MDIVILCGGNGTRLFPLSRSTIPKQFLNLTHPEKTMFELTVERAKKIKYNHLYIICNEIHLSLVKQQLSNLNNFTIITEPTSRNTCAAISVISQISNMSSFLVLSSDHVWEDDIFANEICNAQTILDNKIVIFGVKPTYPETGYGYIHFSGNNVLQFVEKPSLELAKSYLERGTYLWNSGNFLFDRKFLKEQLQIHANDIFQKTSETLQASIFVKNVLHLDAAIFSQVRNESIDYGIMEHQKECRVIQYSGTWNDIGSFLALYDYLPKDENQNVFQNQTSNISIDSLQNFVSSTKKVALLNVENLCIVETDDILYIGDLKKSQEIKKIVTKLKDQDYEKL